MNLTVWDGGSAERQDELNHEITAYGGRLLAVVEAYPFSQAVPCGFNLIYDANRIPRAYRVFLKYVKGYKFE